MKEIFSRKEILITYPKIIIIIIIVAVMTPKEKEAPLEDSLEVMSEWLLLMDIKIKNLI